MKNTLLKSMLVLVFMASTLLTYAQTDVTIQVIDSTKTLTSVKAKGAFNSWALVDMTKDDTGADANVWSATVSIAADGDYEWGAIQDDGSEWGIWLPSLAGFGSNPVIHLASGVATGDLQVKMPNIDPVDVVVAVDMSFELSKGGFDITTDSVGLAGPINGWSYTKLTKGATDSVYTGTFNTAGYFEHKFRKNDGWEGSPNRGVFVDGATDPLKLDTVWYSDISPAPMVTIKCYVIDGTQYYTGLQYKGEITGWGNVPMYDDGTNGDETAGDHTWTVTLENVTSGQTYEWGAVDVDDNWLISGPNREVVVAGDGSTTGETYTIPAWGSETVHFMVNMNCHINLGVFEVGTTCLDVNIDGYPPVEMTLVDTGVYEASVTRFTVDEVLAYTYRLGCVFGGDYEEYPGGDNNRSITVGSGTTETGVELYQDDVLTESCPYVSVEEYLAQRVSIYPNPANSELNINSEFEISAVTIYSVTGQKIRTIPAVNAFSKMIGIDELNDGLYIISVEGTNGERAISKLMKN